MITPKQSDSIARINPGSKKEVERNAKLISQYSTGSYSYNALSRIFKITPQRVAQLIPQDVKDHVKKLKEVTA